jgi:membrane protein implicated in regulation of membrane protease activity
MAKPLSLLIAALAILLIAPPAEAYIGPGAGITLIGSFIGLLVAVFAALGAVLFWPLRRMMRRRKAAASATPPPDAAKSKS